MTEETIIPKGPKGLPYFGSTFSFASPNRLDWMASLLDKHGDVFSFKMMNRKFYMINHPDYVKEILATKMSKYSKESGGFRVLKKVLGESVFTASGDVWKRKRTLVQPQFHKKKINQLAEVMTSLTDEMLNRWEVNFEKKEPVDIKIEMMNITLGVVTRAMFGEALSDEDFQKVVDVFTPILQETNMRLLYPFKVRRYFNKKSYEMR